MDLNDSTILAIVVRIELGRWVSCWSSITITASCCTSSTSKFCCRCGRGGWNVAHGRCVWRRRQRHPMGRRFGPGMFFGDGRTFR